MVMASHDPAAINYVSKAYFIRDGALEQPSETALRAWLTEGTEI